MLRCGRPDDTGAYQLPVKVLTETHDYFQSGGGS